MYINPFTVEISISISGLDKYLTNIYHKRNNELLKFLVYVWLPRNKALMNNFYGKIWVFATRTIIQVICTSHHYTEVLIALATVKLSGWMREWEVEEVGKNLWQAIIHRAQ